jgi:hypothetical protein
MSSQDACRYDASHTVGQKRSACGQSTFQLTRLATTQSALASTMGMHAVAVQFVLHWVHVVVHAVVHVS